MNRLSPLIVRRPRIASPARSERPAAAAVFTVQAAPSLPEELRLFATGFLGGLAFFGAYLA